MTRRPKFSNMGSRSEMGTGSPSLTIFRCTRSGFCSGGRCRLRRSVAGLLAQRFQVGDVLQCIARRHVFLVAHREGAPITVGQRDASGLALVLHDDIAQPV